MKRKSLLLICAALLMGVLLGTCASADFTRTQTYSEGMFSDVPASEWYAESVKNAYEFGIMKGDSATTFNPSGTLTVAEGVTIAARIYETLNNKPIPQADGEWYQMYVDYAVSNGFLEEGRFEDYDAQIQRYEIAELLADVCGDLPAINNVEKIPDVASGVDYASKVLKLYNAGVLAGNDNYGNFAPYSYLLRSEISAMAVRIADSSLRLQKTLDTIDARAFTDPYYIIEAVQPNGRNGLANGWNYDNRFDLYNTSGTDKSVLSDTADDKFYSLIRDFDPEYEGVLRLEALIDATSGETGIYIAFENADEDILFQLTPKGGKWAFAGTTEVVTPVEISDTTVERFAIEMDIDLDNNTASLVINNIPCGTVSIPEDAVLSRLVLGTNKVGKGNLSMLHVRLSKNYAVNDRFLVGREEVIGQTPANWEISGDFAIDKMESMRGYDYFSVKADSKAGTVSTAERSFIPVTGKISFETMILLPENTDGASVALTSAGQEVIKFETRDGKLYVGDIMVNDYTANIWQTLHVDADTLAGTAEIKVNGKTKATVDITAKVFDGVKITFAPDKDAVMWFDDVNVYNLIDHADYPSYPQVAESTDYNIGLNVCWLWRDQQSGEGWDSVSPFPEFDSFLGFYDEGLRETADWELKWMAEHGIDFIHACWYCPSGDVRNPIKGMRHSYSALHDGYMNAKYSDLVDFCIMWENNGQDCTSFEQFREYIWNYWVEYYFKDPRYARLDNKAVLTVWNRTKFETAFGGAEGTREAVSFMNEELKKLGYDGIIILASTQGANPSSTYTDITNLGYDATYGYHWGPNGYSADYQIECNEADIASSAGISHHIPTVSVGFNDVGRNETRDPIITGEDHLRVCQYIKETLDTFDTGTWKDNTLFVSTWNEYSEGTYVLPTASNGFDYLENIRLTFTNDTSDHSALDVKPTQAQIDRVSHMYPPNHAPIRWFQFEEPSADESGEISTDSLVPVITYDMSTEEGTGLWENQFGMSDYSEENGVIKGTGAGEDYAIRLDPEAWFEADTAPVLHIRIKNDAMANIEVFYTTDSDTAWNSKKSKTVAITSTGEFVDYYINMTTTGTWTGKITGLRIDPQSAAGTFEISLIELMNFPPEGEDAIPSVVVNGALLDFTFYPEILEDGEFEVVGEARQKGFYSAMRVYHEWDRFTGDGVLTLKTRDEKTLVFTVGSDKVLVDGEEQELGFTFRLRDGLPVFHLKKLCDLLGYKYTVEGKTISVQAATDEEYEILKNRVPDQWEFEVGGETEGWRTQNCSITIINGRLIISPANSDPAVINTVFFDADDYTHVAIGVVYDKEALANQRPQLFFTTKSSTSYTADKCINGEYNGEGLEDGDILEVIFDLGSNSLFSGTITGLRFDPLGSTSTVEVEYIRCENDPSKLGKATGEIIEVDDENQWYFDTDGDAEGWRTQNATAAQISGGYLKSTGQNGDPAIVRDVSFSANDYQVAVVGVRYTEALKDASADFFFITKSSPTWASDKGIGAKYQIPELVSVGETVELTFYLTNNANWKGDITAIRIDPFSKNEEFEIDYVRLFKLEGYEPEEEDNSEPEDSAQATKPTTVTITDVNYLPEGVKVYSEHSSEVIVTKDPEDESKNVFQVNCIKDGEQYSYLNVGMQFEAGKTYKISYKIYPLTDKKGNDYEKTIIGGNFRFATSSTPTIKDHTFANESNRSTGDGWISVEAEYTVPQDYTPTDNDCFQIWGKPVNQIGISYLASDISIQLK